MKDILSFEDLSIRKSYLSKMQVREGVDKFIKDFESYITITSNMMYNKFYPSFSRCGMNLDDINSLAKMYAMYYFNIYSQEKDQDQKVQRNALITFIRQRAEYLAMICERQSENFHVSKNLSGFYAKTEKSMETTDDVIIGDPKAWGYRRVRSKELKEIRKNKRGALVDKNGFEVIRLEFVDSISPEDYEDILYQNSSVLQSPEDMLLENERRYESDMTIDEFESKSMVNKIGKLKAMRAFSKSKEDKRNIDKLIRLIENESRSDNTKQ